MCKVIEERVRPITEIMEMWEAYWDEPHVPASFVLRALEFDLEKNGTLLERDLQHKITHKSLYCAAKTLQHTDPSPDLEQRIKEEYELYQIMWKGKLERMKRLKN